MIGGASSHVADYHIRKREDDLSTIFSGEADEIVKDSNFVMEKPLLVQIRECLVHLNASVKLCLGLLFAKTFSTTHPYLALQFLTSGSLDPATGLFLSPTGHAKYYRATDNLRSDHYQGLLPEDLVEILTVNKLHYSHGSESGVLFHLIGALSEFGKIGMTAISNSHEEVDELYARTLDVLDRETQYGR